MYLPVFMPLEMDDSDHVVKEYHANIISLNVEMHERMVHLLEQTANAEISLSQNDLQLLFPSLADENVEYVSLPCASHAKKVVFLTSQKCELRFLRLIDWPSFVSYWFQKHKQHSYAMFLVHYE
jgi:hypothetical protein